MPLNIRFQGIITKNVILSQCKSRNAGIENRIFKAYAYSVS